MGENVRPKERIPIICKKLEKLWLGAQDQRLGQLLENYIFNEGERGDKTSVRLFYQEDDKTEKKLDEVLKEL